VACNCGRPAKKQRPNPKEYVINKDKIVEVAAYRCEEGHILIDADGPGTEVVDALSHEMKEEPRIRIKPRERGAPQALQQLALPKRQHIRDDYKWGETTCGVFLDVAKRFPFNR